MKNFLVPIDFSDTSINAARYALDLIKNIPEAKITFYHVYGTISFATLTSKEEGSRQKVSEQALRDVVEKLGADKKENITLVAEEGSFLENLNEYTLGHYTEMVIMGITGSSRITQVFMGTNTLNVIRNISCPVMIIPANATYKGFKHVVFTSDFKDVARTTPFSTLDEILRTFEPQLDIVNVDSDHFVELTDEYKKEKDAMEDKLGQYNPKYSFLRTYDFLDGINSYVETNEIDVIITIPKERSFVSQLFKTSHTKKLAYHSTVPILAIPS